MIRGKNVRSYASSLSRRGDEEGSPIGVLRRQKGEVEKCEMVEKENFFSSQTTTKTTRRRSRSLLKEEDRNRSQSAG